MSSMMESHLERSTEKALPPADGKSIINDSGAHSEHLKPSFFFSRATDPHTDFSGASSLSSSLFTDTDSSFAASSTDSSVSLNLSSSATLGDEKAGGPLHVVVVRNGPVRFSALGKGVGCEPAAVCMEEEEEEDFEEEDDAPSGKESTASGSIVKRRRKKKKDPSPKGENDEEEKEEEEEEEEEEVGDGLSPSHRLVPLASSCSTETVHRTVYPRPPSSTSSKTHFEYAPRRLRRPVSPPLTAAGATPTPLTGEDAEDGLEGITSSPEVVSMGGKDEVNMGEDGEDEVEEEEEGHLDQSEVQPSPLSSASVSSGPGSPLQEEVLAQHPLPTITAEEVQEPDYIEEWFHHGKSLPWRERASEEWITQPIPVIPPSPSPSSSASSVSSLKSPTPRERVRTASIPQEVSRAVAAPVPLLSRQGSPVDVDTAGDNTFASSSLLCAHSVLLETRRSIPTGGSSSSSRRHTLDSIECVYHGSTPSTPMTVTSTPALSSPFEEHQPVALRDPTSPSAQPQPATKEINRSQEILPAEHLSPLLSKINVLQEGSLQPLFATEEESAVLQSGTSNDLTSPLPKTSATVIHSMELVRQSPVDGAQSLSGMDLRSATRHPIYAYEEEEGVETSSPQVPQLMAKAVEVSMSEEGLSADSLQGQMFDSSTSTSVRSSPHEVGEGDASESSPKMKSTSPSPPASVSTSFPQVVRYTAASSATMDLHSGPIASVNTSAIQEEQASPSIPRSSVSSSVSTSLPQVPTRQGVFTSPMELQASPINSVNTSAMVESHMSPSVITVSPSTPSATSSSVPASEHRTPTPTQAGHAPEEKEEEMFQDEEEEEEEEERIEEPPQETQNAQREEEARLVHRDRVRRLQLRRLPPPVKWAVEQDAYYEELRLTRKNAILIGKEEQHPPHSLQRPSWDAEDNSFHEGSVRVESGSANTQGSVELRPTPNDTPDVAPAFYPAHIMAGNGRLSEMGRWSRCSTHHTNSERNDEGEEGKRPLRLSSIGEGQGEGPAGATLTYFDNAEQHARLIQALDMLMLERVEQLLDDYQRATKAKERAESELEATLPPAVVEALRRGEWVGPSDASEESSKATPDAAAVGGEKAKRSAHPTPYTGMLVDAHLFEDLAVFSPLATEYAELTVLLHSPRGAKEDLHRKRQLEMEMAKRAVFLARAAMNEEQALREALPFLSFDAMPLSAVPLRRLFLSSHPEVGNLLDELQCIAALEDGQGVKKDAKGRQTPPPHEFDANRTRHALSVMITRLAEEEYRLESHRWKEQHDVYAQYPFLPSPLPHGLLISDIGWKEDRVVQTTVASFLAMEQGLQRYTMKEKLILRTVLEERTTELALGTLRALDSLYQRYPFIPRPSLRGIQHRIVDGVLLTDLPLEVDEGFQSLYTQLEEKMVKLQEGNDEEDEEEEDNGSMESLGFVRWRDGSSGEMSAGQNEWEQAFIGEDGMRRGRKADGMVEGTLDGRLVLGTSIPSSSSLMSKDNSLLSSPSCAAFRRFGRDKKHRKKNVHTAEGEPNGASSAGGGARGWLPSLSGANEETSHVSANAVKGKRGGEEYSTGGGAAPGGRASLVDALQSYLARLAKQQKALVAYRMDEDEAIRARHPFFSYPDVCLLPLRQLGVEKSKKIRKVMEQRVLALGAPIGSDDHEAVAQIDMELLAFCTMRAFEILSSNEKHTKLFMCPSGRERALVPFHELHILKDEDILSDLRLVQNEAKKRKRKKRAAHGMRNESNGNYPHSSESNKKKMKKMMMLWNKKNEERDANQLPVEQRNPTSVEGGEGDGESAERAPLAPPLFSSSSEVATSFTGGAVPSSSAAKRSHEASKAVVGGEDQSPVHHTAHPNVDSRRSSEKEHAEMKSPTGISTTMIAAIPSREPVAPGSRPAKLELSHKDSHDSDIGMAKKDEEDPTPLLHFSRRQSVAEPPPEEQVMGADEETCQQGQQVEEEVVVAEGEVEKVEEEEEKKKEEVDERTKAAPPVRFYPLMPPSLISELPFLNPSRTIVEEEEEDEEILLAKERIYRRCDELIMRYETMEAHLAYALLQLRLEHPHCAHDVNPVVKTDACFQALHRMYHDWLHILSPTHKLMRAAEMAMRDRGIMLIGDERCELDAICDFHHADGALRLSRMNCGSAAAVIRLIQDRDETLYSHQLWQARRLRRCLPPLVCEEQQERLFLGSAMDHIHAGSDIFLDPSRDTYYLFLQAKKEQYDKDGRQAASRCTEHLLKRRAQQLKEDATRYDRALHQKHQVWLQHYHFLRAPPALAFVALEYLMKDPVFQALEEERCQLLRPPVDLTERYPFLATTIDGLRISSLGLETNPVFLRMAASKENIVGPFKARLSAVKRIERGLKKQFYHCLATFLEEESRLRERYAFMDLPKMLMPLQQIHLEKDPVFQDLLDMYEEVRHALREEGFGTPTKHGARGANAVTGHIDTLVADTPLVRRKALLKSALRDRALLLAREEFIWSAAQLMEMDSLVARLPQLYPEPLKGVRLTDLHLSQDPYFLGLVCEMETAKQEQQNAIESGDQTLPRLKTYFTEKVEELEGKMEVYIQNRATETRKAVEEAQERYPFLPERLRGVLASEVAVILSASSVSSSLTPQNPSVALSPQPLRPFTSSTAALSAMGERVSPHTGFSEAFPSLLQPLSSGTASALPSQSVVQEERRASSASQWRTSSYPAASSNEETHHTAEAFGEKPREEDKEGESRAVPLCSTVTADTEASEVSSVVERRRTPPPSLPSEEIVEDSHTPQELLRPNLHQQQQQREGERQRRRELLERYDVAASHVRALQLYDIEECNALRARHPYLPWNDVDGVPLLHFLTPERVDRSFRVTRKKWIQSFARVPCLREEGMALESALREAVNELAMSYITKSAGQWKALQASTAAVATGVAVASGVSLFNSSTGEQSPSGMTSLQRSGVGANRSLPLPLGNTLLDILTTIDIPQLLGWGSGVATHPSSYTPQQGAKRLEEAERRILSDFHELLFRADGALWSAKSQFVSELSHLREAHPLVTADVNPVIDMDAKLRKLEQEYSRPLEDFTQHIKVALESMDQTADSIRMRAAALVMDEQFVLAARPRDLWISSSGGEIVEGSGKSSAAGDGTESRRGVTVEDPFASEMYANVLGGPTPVGQAEPNHGFSVQRCMWGKGGGEQGPVAGKDWLGRGKGDVATSAPVSASVLAMHPNSSLLTGDGEGTANGEHDASTGTGDPLGNSVPLSGKEEEASRKETTNAAVVLQGGGEGGSRGGALKGVSSEAEYEVPSGDGSGLKSPMTSRLPSAQCPSLMISLLPSAAGKTPSASIGPNRFLRSLGQQRDPSVEVGSVSQTGTYGLPSFFMDTTAMMDHPEVTWDRLFERAVYMIRDRHLSHRWIGLQEVREMGKHGDLRRRRRRARPMSSQRSLSQLSEPVAVPDNLYAEVEEKSEETSVATSSYRPPAADPHSPLDSFSPMKIGEEGDVATPKALYETARKGKPLSIRVLKAEKEVEESPPPNIESSGQKDKKDSGDRGESSTLRASASVSSSFRRRRPSTSPRPHYDFIDPLQNPEEVKKERERYSLHPTSPLLYVQDKKRMKAIVEEKERMASEAGRSNEGRQEEGVPLTSPPPPFYVPSPHPPPAVLRGEEKTPEKAGDTQRRPTRRYRQGATEMQEIAVDRHGELAETVDPFLGTLSSPRPTTGVDGGGPPTAGWPEDRTMPASPRWIPRLPSSPPPASYDGAHHPRSGEDGSTPRSPTAEERRRANRRRRRRQPPLATAKFRASIRHAKVMEEEGAGEIPRAPFARWMPEKRLLSKQEREARETAAYIQTVLRRCAEALRKEGGAGATTSSLHLPGRSRPLPSEDEVRADRVAMALVYEHQDLQRAAYHLAATATPASSSKKTILRARLKEVDEEIHEYLLKTVRTRVYALTPEQIQRQAAEIKKERSVAASQRNTYRYPSQPSAVVMEMLCMRSGKGEETPPPHSVYASVAAGTAIAAAAPSPSPPVVPPGSSSPTHLAAPVSTLIRVGSAGEDGRSASTKGTELPAGTLYSSTPLLGDGAEGPSVAVGPSASEPIPPLLCYPPSSIPSPMMAGVCRRHSLGSGRSARSTGTRGSTRSRSPPSVELARCAAAQAAAAALLATTPPFFSLENVFRTLNPRQVPQRWAHLTPGELKRDPNLQVLLHPTSAMDAAGLPSLPGKGRTSRGTAPPSTNGAPAASPGEVFAYLCQASVVKEAKNERLFMEFPFLPVLTHVLLPRSVSDSSSSADTTTGAAGKATLLPSISLSSLPSLGVSGSRSPQGTPKEEGKSGDNSFRSYTLSLADIGFESHPDFLEAKEWNGADTKMQEQRLRAIVERLAKERAPSLFN